MNQSIKLNTSCELINLTPLNPLISKCQVKVCYVGDEPNRNRSIISKETAYELANSLPGSPIVGFYNEETGDFEGHNRAIDISDGKLKMKDTTRPYGFVDLNAKCWFQKFLDDGVEHEYLMTEGYLWTGQYPEAKRIIEKGNNQSMELDENLIDGYWTKSINGEPQFFIINEAIISKLCILGEDVEPCFEGAQITKVQFSFEDNFTEKLFSMINEIKELLSEGGAPVEENKIETPIVEEEEVEVVFEEETTVEEEAPMVEEETTEAAPETEFEDEEEGVCPECGKPESECECEEEEEEEIEDKKDKYNLEDIQEYMELSQRYSELETKYNSLETNYLSIKTEYESLVEFKASVDKKEKQEMIDSFYMLSDEDKKEVQENIDKYSKDEIEAKLSIICVRNKVSFNLEDEESSKVESTTTYNLNETETEVVPAWIKAVQTVAKKMN